MSRYRAYHVGIDKHLTTDRECDEANQFEIVEAESYLIFIPVLALRRVRPYIHQFSPFYTRDTPRLVRLLAVTLRHDHHTEADTSRSYHCSATATHQNRPRERDLRFLSAFAMSVASSYFRVSGMKGSTRIHLAVHARIEI